MRVSLIIPSFFPAVVYGGPIFSTLHTLEKLAKMQDMEIFVSTTNANMTKKLDKKTNIWQKIDDGFFVKYYDETIINKISFPLLFNLWRDIKKTDMVHIQSIFSTPTLIGLFYAKIFRKPIMLSPRGQFGPWCLAHGSNFKQLWLDLLIKPFVKNILWHATSDQEKLEIKAIFPEADVIVITNGISFNTFDKSTRLSKKDFVQKFAKKQMSHVEKIIVSMGRLQKKKGFDILIASFAKAMEIFPHAKLLIAGNDEGEKQNLVHQIERLGLKESVFLIGHIAGQDKIDFLANADLFVLPSHNENFGNVYLESLAAGTPIIASKNTPWSEVEDGGCGKWVDNNVNDVTRAMIDMLNKESKNFRVNAKQFAKKYDWENIAKQFQLTYCGMIGHA